MEKNISVTDVQGRIYEATYPKRAKGLVKKGRARFVDEFTICLACPPDKTEDNEMDYMTSMDRERIQDDQNGGRQTTDSAGGAQMKSREAEMQIERFTMVLGQIEQVLKNIGYLEKALDAVESVGDDSEALKAITTIVQCRETTNQRMVDSAMKVLEMMLARENTGK